MSCRAGHLQVRCLAPVQAHTAFHPAPSFPCPSSPTSCPFLPQPRHQILPILIPPPVHTSVTPHHLSQQYDDAYARQYENEHTWEQLQEDEHGNLQLVGEVWECARSGQEVWSMAGQTSSAPLRLKAFQQQQER